MIIPSKEPRGNESIGIKMKYEENIGVLNCGMLESFT
jgi:hypothetical protein